MDWMASIDGYCERVLPGFGGEPFNALTGLGFLVVGLLAARRGPAGDDRRAGAALALVGVASAGQHAFAVTLTLWADVAANLLYLVLLGVLLLRRLAGAGVLVAGVAAVVAVALAYQAVQGGVLRVALGPAADLFVLLALVLTGAALLVRRAHPATSARIVAAVAILVAGLPFRFLDQSLCPAWPTGTHGLWHLMNAAASALLLAALARHQGPGRPQPGAA
jgi:hypothetical protein